MRQVLARFADSEKKRILREIASAAAKRKADEAAKGEGGPAPRVASGG
jgi:hypothetical protein